MNNKSIYIITKAFCLIFLLSLVFSCEKEELEDEDCIEEICPDGFNSCIERPCDFDQYRNE